MGQDLQPQACYRGGQAFQKQMAQMMQMLSVPHEDTQDDGQANRGQLATLMEELLLESRFVPATPRPSAVRITPHVEDVEAQASEMKTVLQKMEVLREDQKIGTNVRFCKNGNHADSAANFCSKATKLTKEKLHKAIEVIEASQRLQLSQ